MIRFFLLLILALGISESYAQGIQVIGDSQLYEIQRIRYERKKAAESKPDTMIVQGYRVQIYFSNDRKKAHAIRDKLKTMFPEYAEEVYVPYQSPNYKVRVGNFIKESDARVLEKQLAKNFENVFIVRDMVRYIKNRPKEEEE